MPQLSVEDKMRIVTLYEEEWSLARIAERFGKPKSTIQAIVKKWREQHTVERLRGTGLKKISTNEEDENLVQFLRDNPFETAVSAARVTQFPGCNRTAQLRVVQCSNLRNRSAASKPFLQNIHKEQRMGFALQYLPVGLNFWTRNVIFSDEKVFQSTYNGRIRVYRPPSCRYDENYTQKRNNSGRFSINVWAWISAQGPGVCWNIGGALNSNSYLEILENVLLPSARIMFGNNFIFQQDNCPVHTARRVKEWFQRNNITCLAWCSRSPDLNPIENVSGLMVKKMYSINFRPQNEIELWQKIEEIWEEITPDYTNTLVSSMPNRLQQVLDSNGAAIKY